MPDDVKPGGDEELYKRAGEGDIAAFEQLVRHYQNVLFGYFLRRTRRSGVAEELAQEVFLRLWKYAPSYEIRSRFQTYLYRVAHNIYVDYRRREKVRPQEFSLDTDEGTAIDAAAVDEAPSPDEFIDTKDLKRKLREALERLPDREREILLLVLDEGLHYSQCAEVLKIPEGTVKSRTHAAIARLRRFMRSG